MPDSTESELRDRSMNHHQLATTANQPLQDTSCPLNPNQTALFVAKRRHIYGLSLTNNQATPVLVSMWFNSKLVAQWTLPPTGEAQIPPMISDIKSPLWSFVGLPDQPIYFSSDTVDSADINVSFYDEPT